MKKHVYQQPQLTIVSFRVERGFASSSQSEGAERTFGLSALFDGDGGSGFEERSCKSSDSWGSGW